jgi:hypothetical protein
VKNKITENLYLICSMFKKLIIKKSKVVPVLNEEPHHEDIWGSGGIGPQFLTSAPRRG